MSTKKPVWNQEIARNNKSLDKDNRLLKFRESARVWLYEHVLTDLTSGWYHHVLTRLPDNARLLDVGIGTGGAVSRNADLVRAKNIQVRGIDIDREYLNNCNPDL